MPITMLVLKQALTLGALSPTQSPFPPLADPTLRSPGPRVLSLGRRGPAQGPQGPTFPAPNTQAPFTRPPRIVMSPPPPTTLYLISVPLEGLEGHSYMGSLKTYLLPRSSES